MQALRILWAVLLLASQVAAGQSFAYRADLGTAAADSFYRVLLPPVITSRLQPGFADLRLYDSQQGEVPYLLLRDAPAPSQPGRYQLVPGLAFRQHGSQQHKKTILRFSAPTPLLIDQLVFTVAAPSLYHRQATLYQRQQHRGRRRRGGYQAVRHFVLAANTGNTLHLTGFRSRDFYVEIENGDSPPLVVKTVGAYQLATYLVAALEQGEAYHLAFGSKAALSPPAYDLSYFRDRIPRQLATLQPGAIKLNPPPQKGSSVNAFFTNRFLIWAALLAVVVLLGYMSYKMLQETQKRS